MKITVSRLVAVWVASEEVYGRGCRCRSFCQFLIHRPLRPSRLAAGRRPPVMKRSVRPRRADGAPRRVPRPADGRVRGNALSGQPRPCPGPCPPGSTCSPPAPVRLRTRPILAEPLPPMSSSLCRCVRGNNSF